MNQAIPGRITQSKALASKSRMEILKLLKQPLANFPHQKSADPSEFGVCMNLIAERLGVSQPTVSRHIDLLRQAGFLRVKRQHRWSYCSRDEEGLTEYHRWLKDELLGNDGKAS